MTNYIDIKLTNVSDAIDILGYFDITVDENGDIEKEDGFDTNIIMSLFCERRATVDEVVDPISRRGWWGNTLSDTPGFEIGSKLWLLDQSKLTQGNVNLSSQYAEQALKWLIDGDFVRSVVVSSTPAYIASSPNITLKIDLIRLDNEVEYKYFNIWEATGRV